MAQTDAQLSRGLTYVIGVSGHRDIPNEDVEGVTRRVTDVLSEIRNRIPEVRLELVTGLAVGADAIAVRAALDLGIAVRAVLPMPLKQYRLDFSGDELDEFEALIASPGVVVEEIPSQDTSNDSASDSRDAAYARLGDYLSRRTNLPLVLWDGNRRKVTGGTADTLSLFLGISHLPDALDHASEGGAEIEQPSCLAAVWIPVRRSLADQEPDVDVAFIVRPSVNGELSVVSTLPDAPLEEMQERAELFRSMDPSQVSNPLGGGSIEATPEVQRRLDEINAMYVEADSLALRYGKYSTEVFRWLAMIGALMGFFFLVYAKISTTQPYIAAYLVLVAAAVVVSRVGSRGEWLAHYLVNRAIAETARIRFYLTRAGVGEALSGDRLLHLTGVENLAGFGPLLHARKVGVPLLASSDEPTAGHLAAIREDWVDDQAGYLASKVRMLGSRERLLDLTRSTLFGLSFISAILLCFFAKDLSHFYVVEGLKVKTALIFLMGLLPLFLALWELYQYKLASQELHWQFENQGMYFRIASERLASAGTWDQQRQILEDLEEQSLFEVYLWVIHRYHREFEPTLPG